MATRTSHQVATSESTCDHFECSEFGAQHDIDDSDGDGARSLGSPPTRRSNRGQVLVISVPRWALSLPSDRVGRHLTTIPVLRHSSGAHPSRSEIDSDFDGARATTYDRRSANPITARSVDCDSLPAGTPRRFASGFSFAAPLEFRSVINRNAPRIAQWFGDLDADGLRSCCDSLTRQTARSRSSTYMLPDEGGIVC